MADQKAENLLNLALDATAEELEKSPALSVGFNREEKRWELIVKYNGDLNVVLEALPEIEADHIIWRLCDLNGTAITNRVFDRFFADRIYRKTEKALFFRLQR